WPPDEGGQRRQPSEGEEGQQRVRVPDHGGSGRVHSDLKINLGKPNFQSTHLPAGGPVRVISRDSSPPVPDFMHVHPSSWSHPVNRSLTIMASLLLGISGCATLQQIAALRQVAFALD